jgi:hypothetical protein
LARAQKQNIFTIPAMEMGGQRWPLVDDLLD